MTRFEEFLLDKGYSTYILNCKDMKYQKAKGHTISTMVNLDHRYIHNSDVNLLSKVEQGKSVMDEDFTWEDRKGEICFGLHEMGKPSTLISPRPRIKVFKDGIILTEGSDDAMNLVLAKVEHKYIFKAMYDKSICLELDLRSNIITKNQTDGK